MPHPTKLTAVTHERDRLLSVRNYEKNKHESNYRIESLIPWFSIAASALSIGVFGGTAWAADSLLQKLDDRTFEMHGTLSEVDTNLKNLDKRVDGHHRELQTLIKTVAEINDTL